MYISPEKLLYVAVIKQACKDYVNWKRKNDNRLQEVELFIRSLHKEDGAGFDGEWLISHLDEIANSDKICSWKQDIASLWSFDSDDCDTCEHEEDDSGYCTDCYYGDKWQRKGGRK